MNYQLHLTKVHIPSYSGFINYAKKCFICGGYNDEYESTRGSFTCFVVFMQVNSFLAICHVS